MTAEGRGALPAFAAVGFCYFGFVGLFMGYSPLWFEQLGFSAFGIGVLVALQNGTRLGVPYAWAAAADRSGRRVGMLRLAAGGSLLASVGLLWQGGPWWVGAVVAALFVCTAGVMPLTETTLAQWVSRDGVFDTGRYGRVRLWGSIGFVVAVAAGGTALQAAGLEHFPWFVVAMLALLWLATLRLPAVAEPPHAADAAPGGALAKLREPELGWFFAAVFLTVLAHHALYAFLSLHLAAIGYTKSQIGGLWAVGVVAEVLWFAGQGRWYPRLGAYAWLLVAALFTALRLGVIAGLAGVAWLLVLVQAMHAITFAGQHTACLDVVSRHFGGRLRGRGQALYAILGYGASGVLAGVAGGALAQAAGYAAVFWVAAGAGLASAWCARRAARAARAAALR